MRIGITGITGSLGSALARYFARQGHIVIGMSRDELRAERLMAAHGGLDGNVRCAVVSAGLADTEQMTRVFDGCHWLIHAAALKRISGSVYATEEIVKTNIVGTMHVLKMAREVGVKRLMVISSDKAAEATNLYGA